MGHRQLGGDRLPDDDRARRAEISYDVGVVLGDAPRVKRAAAFGRRTRRIEDVLHGDRDAHQGAGRGGRFERGVHEQRRLSVVTDEGVDARLGLAVTPDALFDRRAHGGMMRRTGHLVLAERFGTARRIVTRGVQVFGHPPNTPRTWRKPALRNMASLPKNTKSSLSRLFSARG